ncbi:MAG: hypothetical protein KJN79_09290 [Gammaproteobacteria bacterium]|nr:hypothetical protein [Gammaproteobacteria bacterium]
MAETTHTLKFRADARAIKVLGQEFQKAFDPKSAKAYERELGGLQRRLKDLTSVQTGLVKQLEGVKDGTKEFKKLQDQMKLVGREAKTVKGAIGSMTTAYREFNAERKRGFVAGMGQGLGIAQYIPSEAGMGRRMAGAAIGQGVRGVAGRIGGAAMAPIRNPGVGGLASMVGAIPVLGQMASGQIQALAGMYQEAVAFKSAARGALFAQGAGPSAAQRASRIAAAEVEVKRIKKEGALAEEQAKDMTQARYRRGVRVQNRQAALQEKIIKDKGGLSASPGMGGLIASHLESKNADVSDIEEAPAVSTKMRGGRKIVRGIYGRTSKFRQDLGAEIDVKKVQKDTAERIAKVRARARYVDTGLPGVGEGVKYGLGGQAMMQGFTQFMQARGGTWDDVKRKQFEQQMAAGTMGVSAGLAGQYARMGVPGGGGKGSTDLAGALSMAVQIGLKGSQVPEYLQSLVGLGSRAEKMGVKIDEKELGRGSALMRTMGIKGPQIGRVMSGVQGAAMDLSQRGVSSPVDMIMMRAAGYEPSQGVEGYSRAINKIEGGMDLGMLNQLMGMATAGATGGVGGAGRETQILMMKRFFGRLKTPISANQATMMLDAYQNGKLNREHVGMLTRNIEGGERKNAHGWLTKGAQADVRRGAGITITEASLEADRIRLGNKMSGTMAKLNEANMNAASAVAAFSGQLKTVATWMATFTKKLEKAAKAGASGGLWSFITTAAE